MTKVTPGNPENKNCSCSAYFTTSAELEDKIFQQIFSLENVEYRKLDSTSADTYGTAVCKSCGRKIGVVQYFMESMWNKV